MHGNIIKVTYIVQDDQWTIDTSDGIVADTGLDGGHPRVHELRHDDDGAHRTRRSSAR